MSLVYATRTPEMRIRFGIFGLGALLLLACGKTKPASMEAAADADATETSPDGGAADLATDSDAPAADAAGAADATTDASSEVVALPKCSSLPNPFYVMSGDTQVPILKALGKALR